MQNKSRRTFAAENKEISLLDKKSLKKFRQTKTNFVSFLYASKLQWDVQSLTRSQFNKTILLVFVIFLQIGNLQKIIVQSLLLVLIWQILLVGKAICKNLYLIISSIETYKWDALLIELVYRIHPWEPIRAKRRRGCLQAKVS